MSTWAGIPQDQVHPPGTRYTPWTRYTAPGTRYTHSPRTIYIHPLGPGTPPWDQVHPPGPGTPPTRYTPRPGTPPGTRYTLQTRYTPFDQVHPPGTRYTPRTRFTPWTRYTPQEQCMLGDMGNKRAVRILLECILVVLIFRKHHMTNPSQFAVYKNWSLQVYSSSGLWMTLF